ncbi:MAG: NTP transferase domain-containing protein [Chloroflexota bacterium]|jgi:CTP:molybdopterin cytidylyltransferase MocA
MKIVAAILAAGLSRRLGRPKQLLNWHGIPLVRHSTQTMIDAGVARVGVIIGHQAAHVRVALAGLPVDLTMNPDFADGQGSSVACAARWAIEHDADALVIGLCDQPLLQSAHVRQIVSAWIASQPAVLVPRVKQQPTNPVVWSRALLAELSTLTGEQGGRLLFQRGVATPTWYDMQTPELLEDIDSEEDYQRLCNK